MASPTIPPVSTMGTLTPYITVKELKRSPVYTQLRQLVPGSSDADRDAELSRIITRASAMINGEVNQNLAATVDHEIGMVTVSDHGELRIHTRATPILQVLSVAVGPTGDSLVEVSDLSRVMLEPWRIIVPSGAGGGASFRPRERLWARWSYINGFPVTTLAAVASAGDSTVTVKNATGVVAGKTLLTVDDGQWLEQFVPTAVDGGTLTIPPLMHDHEIGTGVSALPEDIKEAALLLISRLHDTWSLTMNAVSAEGQGARNLSARPKIMCDCGVILAPYRRWW